MSFQLNDAFIGPLDWTINLYMHPSKWHADRFHGLYPEMTPSKSRWRMTNGVDYNRYLQHVVNGVGPARDEAKVIYTSSPDRGLHHLLRIWPSVKEARSDATLDVYYDINKWLELCQSLHDKGYYNATYDRSVYIREFLAGDYRPLGVTFHGGVGQGELALAQMKAKVLCYPCDPVQPTEGFSMTILEGVVAGCEVVTSNADAFPELWASTPGVTMLPLPIDDNLWAQTIATKLDSPAEDYRVNFELGWPKLAQRWQREIDQCLQQKQ
jgi:glycosyltransferase involved in cell wall biosynthesis